MRCRRPHSLSVAGLIAAIGLGGCAMPPGRSRLGGDVSAQHGRRKEEVVTTFQTQRDRAQLEAARSRWLAGDGPGCRKDLEALLARNPNYAEAQLLFQQVEAAEPAQPSRMSESGQRHLTAGELALAEADLAGAEEHLRAAVQTDPRDPRIPIRAASIALREGQPALAVRILQPAAERLPSDAGLLRNLGAAYYRLGDYRSSQLVLQQALSLDKSSSLTYFLLGCTLDKLGQATPAAECFAAAKRTGPLPAAVR